MPPACCAPSVRPWNALSKETMTFLARPPDFTPCVRHSLMAHLDGFRAGGEQEDLLQRLGQNGDQLFDQARADLAGEAIIGEQVRGGLRGDGVHDLLAAVAGVGDQHAGGPVDPLVAPGVEDLEAFGAMPDDGRLAAHGDGLVGVQALQDGQRLGHRQIRHDAAEGRLHARDGRGDETVFFGHNPAPLYSPVLCFTVASGTPARRPGQPHRIAISKPPLMPIDRSCPRPKLYS